MYTKKIKLNPFRRTETHKIGENRDRKYIAPFGMFIGILILLSAGIGVASACETYVLVNPGESIQSAIDSICPEGGIVELAAGTYNLSQEGTINVTIHKNQKTTITPTQVGSGHWIGDVTYPYAILLNERNNITIKGAGRDDTVLINEGEGYPLYDMLFILKGSDNTIKDLSIKSNSASIPPKTAGCAIQILGKNLNTTISNVKGEWLARGVACSDTIHLLVEYHAIENLTIKDSLFYRCQSGIVGTGTYNSTITNCECSYSSQYGIDLNQKCQYIVVEKCKLHHNGNAGVATYTGNYENIIRDNVCYENHWYGIWLLYNPRYIEIINNTCRNNMRSGIKIAPLHTGGGGPDHINVSNNRVYNNDEHGIDLTPAYFGPGENDVTIESNTIHNNGGDGIHENVGLYDIVVKNNIITNNSGYGINHLHDESQFIISYNDVWGNALGSYNGVSAGTGDIEADPKFADAANYDFHLKSSAGRLTENGWIYTDTEDSPCIDAGDPDDGYYEPEPNGGIINMGAYGNTGEASLSPGAATGTISGNVTNTTGTPIEGATVQANGYSNTTNSTGCYTIANVPVGNYTVTAFKEGYENATKNATVVANETSVVDFTMNPVGDTLPPTTNATIIPAPNEAGWNNVTPVTVVFFRNDTGGSGVSYTNLSSPEEITVEIDGFNITIPKKGEGNLTIPLNATFGESFNVTVNDTGITEIWYYSVDNNTNIESTKNVSVKIDITSPNITNVASITTNSATITWDTDEEADTKVTYDTNPSNLGTLWENNSELTKSHSITLIPLNDNTTYYYKVYSTDAAGNTANSTVCNFTTSPVLPGNATAIIQAPSDVNDNRLRSSTPNDVLNDTVWIDVGRLSPDTNFRDVMWFNLSQLNSTDNIKSATLSLFWYYESRNKSTTVEIYRLGDWDENCVNWNNRTNGVAWNNPGGDWYDRNNVAQGNTPYASLAFPVGAPDNAYHEFDVTGLVQGYVSGTYGNAGFFIKANEVGDSYIAFRSSDWGNASERPKLVVSYSWGSSSEDTTPPASISDLQNNMGTTWINWTWDNPLDNDFNHTMVYLNGIWQTNTSDAYYNATGLNPDTSYEIGTHTVDINGNVNTTWVNQTAKTEVEPDETPPVSISDLQNTTGTTWINWTWTNPSDDDFNHTMVYLNGDFKTNASDAYYNATGLEPDTSYEIGTHTVDTNGNVNTTWMNQTTKTAANENVIVGITSLSAAPGETATVPIIVDDGGDNMCLGSGIINVTYNPSVVNVTNVASGTGNALTVQSWNADNTAGWVIITSTDSSQAHNGSVIFANVTYEAVGSCGDSSPLNVTVNSLRNWYTYCQIPCTVSSGTFTILDVAEPLVTNPSATPAAILNDNDYGRPRVPGTNNSQLNISVTDNTAVDTVTIDLSPTGGSAAEEMINIPGTDIWTVTTTATAGIDLTHNLIVTATDIYGNSNTSVSIPLSVLQRGDIVRDNVVDDADMLYIAKYIVGKEPAPDEFVAGIWPADSYDGVDDVDMLYIAKYIVGKEIAP